VLFLVGVRPHAPSWLCESRKSSSGCVDRRLSSEQERVVQPSAKGAAKEWRNHGDPEVVASSLEDVGAVSERVRGHTWTKVSCKVDGVAGLPAEAGSNAENDEEQTERGQRTGADVAVVFQSVDEEHQERAGDEFREEHARPRHELGWVGAEDTGRCGLAVAGNRSDVLSALVHVDGVQVVGVDHERSAESAQGLSHDIGRELSPWEFSEYAVCEGDS